MILCTVDLREQQIWTEIGESEKEKDHMLVELEKECMQVYRRKVDEARSARARLHQSLVSKEAEVASLMALLGEQQLQLEVLTFFVACFPTPLYQMIMFACLLPFLISIDNGI